MQRLDRPVRVVVFGGAFFEHAALEFLARLHEHPEIELVAAFCQSPGMAFRHRAKDVVRRRGLLAPAVLGMYAAQACMRFARRPGPELALRRRVRAALERVVTVADIHAPAVLEHVRTVAPDLGLVYGAPLLRPCLFEIPRFGTLGIHHGHLPRYRGVKTVFWAMFNGEATAGVTIQRINAGLDTGEIVRAGEVPIAGRRYGQVDAELQELGVKLYIDAIMSVKRGDALYRPQIGRPGRLYRQPKAGDIVRLWRRRLRHG